MPHTRRSGGIFQQQAVEYSKAYRACAVSSSGSEHEEKVACQIDRGNAGKGTIDDNRSIALLRYACSAYTPVWLVSHPPGFLLPCYPRLATAQQED